ncbi:MAG: hypothetical protein A3J93_01950 [Candidatus Magasanikbacteria bacterium RIFOXYC2_FULL_42_28]|uniref:Uncharacterized protein n=1 Tax=Candidatus Magasanikbacteria bacterium RIFOXYC2_FULL_42_28 TaxID=1798704 RepID=A0A1F6NX89_9BACT|nr:MAG: hypothetical protein A3J93_01950 [Candidatus Magasanikbacteria bacterium RIFOXYC2_FULL_42_28]
MAERKNPADEAVFGNLADDVETSQLVEGLSSLSNSLALVGDGKVRKIKTRQDLAKALGVEDVKPNSNPIIVEKLNNNS